MKTKRKHVWELLNWVALLFIKAIYVSLTLSHWWCFKNIYFFIMFRYNRGIWTDIKKKKNIWMCFAQNEFWALLTLFFHEKRQGHFRPTVCSWEGETNCLNVSSCETIRLQGCCQGCFWHLAKSLRAVLFPWCGCIVTDFQCREMKYWMPSLIEETTLKLTQITCVLALMWYHNNLLSDSEILLSLNTGVVHCPDDLVKEM